MAAPTKEAVHRWATQHILTTRTGSSGTSTYVMLENIEILSYWYASGNLQIHNTRDAGPGQPGGLDDFDAFKKLSARQTVMKQLQNFKSLQGFENGLGQRDPVFAISDFIDERELECYLNLYLLSIIEVLYRHKQQSA